MTHDEQDEKLLELFERFVIAVEGIAKTMANPRPDKFARFDAKPMETQPGEHDEHLPQQMG